MRKQSTKRPGRSAKGDRLFKAVDRVIEAIELTLSNLHYVLPEQKEFDDIYTTIYQMVLSTICNHPKKDMTPIVVVAAFARLVQLQRHLKSVLNFYVDRDHVNMLGIEDENSGVRYAFGEIKEVCFRVFYDGLMPYHAAVLALPRLVETLEKRERSTPRKFMQFKDFPAEISAFHLIQLEKIFQPVQHAYENYTMMLISLSSMSARFSETKALVASRLVGIPEHFTLVLQASYQEIYRRYCAFFALFSDGFVPELNDFERLAKVANGLEQFQNRVLNRYEYANALAQYLQHIDKLLKGVKNICDRDLHDFSIYTNSRKHFNQLRLKYFGLMMEGDNVFDRSAKQEFIAYIHDVSLTLATHLQEVYLQAIQSFHARLDAMLIKYPGIEMPEINEKRQLLEDCLSKVSEFNRVEVVVESDFDKQLDRVFVYSTLVDVMRTVSRELGQLDRQYSEQMRQKLAHQTLPALSVTSASRRRTSQGKFQPRPPREPRPPAQPGMGMLQRRRPVHVITPARRYLSASR